MKDLLFQLCRAFSADAIRPFRGGAGESKSSRKIKAEALSAATQPAKGNEHERFHHAT